MTIAFHKMHGLGNDFVIIDGRRRPVSIDGARAAAIADRHRGVGCDQLIVLEPSDRADVRMTIFNPDGSEAEACGNATRCVAALVGGAPVIETVAGLLHTLPGGAEPTIAMGQPRFDWQDIPLAYAMDGAAMPVGWDHGLETPMAVNIGNPHVVFFVADSDAVPLGTIGPMIEHDPLFPQRINVNVATIVNRHELRLRVWERGAGLTQACGSGACATAVAAIRRGLVDAPVAVHLPGGTLTIDWALDGAIVMSGPATHVFEGQLSAALSGD